MARLAYISGGTSFSPGGERDWVHAGINRPLVTGDRLWVSEGGRAELQTGSAAIRVGGSTSLTLLNLDDRIVQVQLSQGTLNIRVRRLDRGQVFEIDTPNLAYSIRRPGSYRIDVDPDGGATTVSVRKGQAEVYGERTAFITAEGQTYRFYGSGLRDYETFALMRPDPFDRWSSERDRRWDNSASRRYVSPELIGYEDLDQYGTWRKVRDYGSVWVPNRVAADWAPYRDGHWAWVEPWGWTWIDEAPWGFAPSHYGRWARIDNTWAWVPGPATARPVYAPALVAFVGGSDARSGGGGTVAWFALGPRDVYRPSYAASREYFNNVNTSNTVISRTDIGNRYDNGRQAGVSYSNQQVAGAVVAVLAAAFAESRPVHKETVRVDRDVFSRAPVAAAAPVAPVRASVVGPGSASGAKPPEAAQSRPVVAQAAPPPPPVPFAAKQSALAANAGKALDAAAMARLKSAAPVEAPAVKVVTPTQAVAAPPRPASAPAAAPAAVGPAAPAPAPAASTPPRAAERGAPPPAAIAPRVAPAPGPSVGPAAAPAAARASAPAAAAAPAPAGRPELAPSRGSEPQAGRDRARAPKEPEAANAPAPGSTAGSPPEERGRRQAPATAKPPESTPPARSTVTVPVAPPAAPVAPPPVAAPPARPAPPVAAPVAPSVPPAAPVPPSPPQRATRAAPPAPPAAAAPPGAVAPPPAPPRATPAIPPAPPGAAVPPPPPAAAAGPAPQPPRAVPAVPAKPPAAAAPPPPEPSRAAPAVLPTPAARAASAAQPAAAAGPDPRGPRARTEEGGAPGRRDAASAARGKRDEEAQGRKP